MRKILLIFTVIYCTVSFYSCNFFNKEEKIPAYIQIDSLTYQGISPNIFTCAYVFVNYKLVGVFEYPRTIPVLVSGDAVVTIRPGIDLNGYSYERTIYQMSDISETRITLEPQKIHNINPAFSDLPSVHTAWLENFEQSAITLTAADSLTPQIKVVRNQRPGHTGYIGRIQISPSDTLTEKFDYTYYDSIPIYFQATPGYLEFSYKCNEPFEVRIKAYNIANGELHDKTVLFTYKSPDIWKRMYINFATIVREMGPGFYYKPYFRIRRLVNTNPQDSINIDLDDIRIVYKKSI